MDKTDRTPSLFADLDRPDDVSTVENAFKDELNLAEFPIAALADRVPDGQTTLVFEDRLDRRDGPPIVRKLTISGTAKHGLPTSMDDEVLVGLIQLTKRWNNFTDPRVCFSRYELIEMLGWPQTGQSYRRIEEALHRWVGVVLSYENAWWDNAAKSWVDENFHVLDNVTLYDRERRRPPRAAATPGAGRRGKRGNAPPPLSSFKWNEVVFRSFQSGNLKQLDLEFYLRLRLPTTKRMFRFLDKRFYRYERIEFDLRTLACEHIGLSRSYKPTELRRRLRPALQELEGHGFLEPMPEPRRYVQLARGRWQIVFVRGPRGRDDGEVAPPPEEDLVSLAESLVSQGVSARAAAELLEEYPADRIRAKLEVFDWLVRQGDRRVGKNPAGYLVASIRDDYQAPSDYTLPAEAEQLAEAEAAAAEAERRRRRVEAEAEAAAATREAELRARWAALSPEDRDAITARVRAENPGLRRWKQMLEPLCLAALDVQPTGDVDQPSLFPGADPVG